MKASPYSLSACSQAAISLDTSWHRGADWSMNFRHATGMLVLAGLWQSWRGAPGRMTTPMGQLAIAIGAGCPS